MLIGFSTIFVLVSALKAPAILSSWFFQLLIGLLVLNAGICTYRQFARAAKAQNLFKTGKGLGRKFERVLHLTSELSLKRLEKHFLTGGYKVARLPGSLWGVKGTFGLWGSPIFHLAILITLLAAIAGSLTGTWGKFIAVEDMLFTENRDAYVVFSEGPLSPKRLERFTLKVNDVKFEQQDDFTILGFSTDVTVIGTRVNKRYTVSKKSPLNINGVTLYQHLFGYAPVISLEKPDGFHQTYSVVLDTFGEFGESFKFKGSLSIPGLADPVSLSLIPGDWTQLIVAPNVERPWETLSVQPGEYVNINGVKLGFLDTRMWASFVAVGNSWKAMIFFGFWLGAIGLVIMYFFSPRSLRISLTAEGALEFVGTTMRYDALFKEEFDRIIAEIKKAEEEK